MVFYFDIGFSSWWVVLKGDWVREVVIKVPITDLYRASNNISFYAHQHELEFFIFFIYFFLCLEIGLRFSFMLFTFFFMSRTDAFIICAAQWKKKTQFIVSLTYHYLVAVARLLILMGATWIIGRLFVFVMSPWKFFLFLSCFHVKNFRYLE